MPQVKNAQFRYRIIDSKIRNPYKPYPSKEDLRVACEEKLYGSEVGERISLSTIEKDLRYMRDNFDAPIKYHAHHQGYYYTEDTFSLEKIPLTEDDIHALRFAAASLLSFKEVEIFKKFDLALAKIFEELAVGNTEDQALGIWFDNKPNAAKGQEYLNPILAAIQEQNTLALSYFSWSSQAEKEYQVFPLLLREYDHLWYVISFDLGSESIRTFELGRILSLEIATAPKPKHVSFNPQQYFDYAFGITVNEKSEPAEIKLLIGDWLHGFLQQNPLHKSQQLRTESQGHVLQLRVYITPELKAKLLSFGSQIKVLEPALLRNWHKEALQEALGNYN